MSIYSEQVIYIIVSGLAGLLQVMGSALRTHRDNSLSTRYLDEVSAGTVFVPPASYRGGTSHKARRTAFVVRAYIRTWGFVPNIRYKPLQERYVLRL
jgi:hypothetical protein